MVATVAMRRGQQQQGEHRGHRAEARLREAHQPVRSVDEDQPERDERVEATDDDPLEDDAGGNRRRYGNAEHVGGAVAPEHDLCEGHDSDERDQGLHDRADDAALPHLTERTAHRCTVLVPRTLHRSVTWELRASAALRCSLITWELRASAAL